MSEDTYNGAEKPRNIAPVTPLHGFRILGKSVLPGPKVLLIICGFGFEAVQYGGHRPFFARCIWKFFGTLYSRMRAAAYPVSPERQFGYAKAFLAEQGLEHTDVAFYGQELSGEIDMTCRINKIIPSISIGILGGGGVSS
jgi:hypothetical protein